MTEQPYYGGRVVKAPGVPYGRGDYGTDHAGTLVELIEQWNDCRRCIHGGTGQQDASGSCPVVLAVFAEEYTPDLVDVPGDAEHDRRPHIHCTRREARPVRAPRPPKPPQDGPDLFGEIGGAA